MSKNINVNPGQYKVAGRERQGEDLAQSPTKQMPKPSSEAGRKPAVKVKAAGKRR